MTQTHTTPDSSSTLQGASAHLVFGDSFGFLTSAQTRDHRLSFPSEPLTCDNIRAIQADYRAMKAARVENPAFVECPRCREHHNEVKNYEGICDRCRLILLENFPHHPFTLDMESHEGFVRKPNEKDVPRSGEKPQGGERRKNL
jgi:hypothetical protein